MRTRRAIFVRFFAVYALLGVLGLAASAYVLLMQRAPVPFVDRMTVRAQFAEADGVLKGVGQPVNVAGVKVGQVVDVRLDDGRALVTMAIDRRDGLDLRADARAVLEPITPLEDMQIALDPGRAPSPALREGATIGVAATAGPVPIGDLLSSLDEDTRGYLSSLIAALGEGTQGRGLDLRRALQSFSPTTDQLARINRELAGRRRELTRLVTNLGAVTRAASRDDELTDLVVAGNATLEAIAAQEGELRAGIGELPAALAQTRATLERVAPFARELEPTLRSVRPGLRALPATLDRLRPFAELGTRTVRDELRPLVRAARPLIRTAAPAVADLGRTAPALVGIGKSLNYLLNELAYNAPGPDEGFLFWGAWAGHNFNSLFSASDAHGNIGRAVRILDCGGLQGEPELKDLLAATELCPN